MRNKTVTAALLATMLGWGAGSVGASDDLSDEAVAVLLDLKTINEILSFCSKEEDGFQNPAKWMTLRAFAKPLPEVYRDRLPMKDPWGGSYMVLGHQQEMVVVSSGPDGVNEVRYVVEDFPDPDPVAKQRIRESDDVILVVGGDVVKGPISRATLQKETMSRMRAIASDVEQFAAENGRYPSRAMDLKLLGTIAPDLRSGRNGQLPLEDAWGYPLLYWSDSKQFMLVSTGADGVLERDYSLGARGAAPTEYLGRFTGEDTDIVYSGGQFVQWPKIHDHH